LLLLWPDFYKGLSQQQLPVLPSQKASGRQRDRPKWFPRFATNCRSKIGEFSDDPLSQKLNASAWPPKRFD
jgi:hypothetical protein